MVMTDSETYTRNILLDLLRIDANNATQDQTDMFDRILDVEKVCSKELRMLCLVDNLLRNVAKDLADDGITNVKEQVDTETFDSFMDRLMSVLDNKAIVGFSSYIVNEPSKDLFLWREQGPEFRSYMKMSQELDSMLVNHSAFSPSELVSPFIITDAPLKRKAIQDLINSPSFQLKPLDLNGKFHEIKLKIEERQKELDVNPDHPETIVIELDKVLSFNFADATSKLNRTDTQDSEELEDDVEPETDITDGEESSEPLDDSELESDDTDVQDATELIDEINPGSNSTDIQDSPELVDEITSGSNSTDVKKSTDVLGEKKPGFNNSTNIDDSAELIDEALPELNSTDIEDATALIDEINGNLFQYINDKEELVLINSILRSLLGDILGVILDLPGKLVGTGGQGKNGRGKGKGGLSVTISLGGENSKDGNGNRPSPRRRPPQ